MPEIKTVSVTYGRKVNLGDFNSANVECHIWAEVEEGDDLDGTMSALWDMAKANVKAQVVPLVQSQKHTAQVTKTFLGLPVDEPEEVQEVA